MGALDQHRPRRHDRTARSLDRARAPADADATEVWNLCREANRECFRTYRVVTLDRPSYFLPAGEVAFQVIENPTQIPDRPPQGVMLRHMEAMDAFAEATFYFLRPVFVTEPCFRLATVDELRREAYFDQFDAFRCARQFGWAFRTQSWLARKRNAAALFALRSATQLVEALAWNSRRRRRVRSRSTPQRDADFAGNSRADWRRAIRSAWQEKVADWKWRSTSCGDA